MAGVVVGGRVVVGAGLVVRRLRRLLSIVCRLFLWFLCCFTAGGTFCICVEQNSLFFGNGNVVCDLAGILPGGVL